MTGNEDSKESIGKRYCWHRMCGTRSSGVFWGIFFIAVGMIWLGKKAGWFPPEWIAMFWPALFIVMGIWIIAASFIRKP